MIFQAGIGWSFISRMSKLEQRQDDNILHISEAKGRIDQHEWRITNHDTRLHLHDEQIDKLRGKDR
jgi:hypothetical protein